LQWVLELEDILKGHPLSQLEQMRAVVSYQPHFRATERSPLEPMRVKELQADKVPMLLLLD
jgi:hypothetical protein